MNVTIKNVPDKTHRTLKREAKTQGRSLNSMIVHLLDVEAARAERRRGLPKALAELEKLWAAMPAMDDSTPLIREDRESR